MKWQEQQSFFNENDHHLQNMLTSGMKNNNARINMVKPDPGMVECRAGLDAGAYGDQFGYGYMNQNTVLKVTDRSSMEGDHMFVHGNASSVLVSSRKRRVEKDKTLQVFSEKQKKIKICYDGVSKITHQNTNNNNNNNSDTNTSSKDKSKVSDVQKPDYIHVRARHGQATDSHSLAERVRRDKISERMKYLQNLVPGCNKITGKAGMLDEIINYVQSLQKQVEFLSMKLATVNPELDFNIFSKEDQMSEIATSEFPALGCSANSAYFDLLNSLDQVVSNGGLDMGINSAEMGLRRSISSPISIPETFMDSSCYNVISCDLSTLFFEL